MVEALAGPDIHTEKVANSLPPIPALSDWEGPKSKSELEFEQKMVKVICGMPASCQNRFKALYMLSEDCIRIKDQFMKEVTELKEKNLKLKQPILAKRDQVIDGKVSDFDEYLPAYDERRLKLQDEVAKITASKCFHQKKEAAKKHHAHIPTDVSHLHGQLGIPDFWRTVVTHNLILQDYIKDKDFRLLDHVTHLNAVKMFEFPS